MRPWLPLLLVFLVAPPLLLWPMPLVATQELLTMPQGEGAGHLWALGAALAERRPLLFHTDSVCFPDGVDALLIDPANLPFFAIGALFGPAAAYNAIFLGGTLLMGIAGALLAWRVGGVAWLGALAAMSCPAFLAGTIRGATEQLAVGWVGIALALLLIALQSGGARRIALAALALGTCAWAGPYNGLWIAAIAITVSLVATVRAPRQASRRLIPAGLGALLVAAPVVWATLTSFSVMNDPRFSNPMAERPLESFRYARGGNIGYADLLDPWVPAPLTGDFSELSQTTYLGLFVIALAIGAVWRRRSLWPWLAGVFAASIVALGPWLYLAGKILNIGHSAVPGPALLLSKLPMMGSLTHWYRVAPVAGLLLAPLVATWGRSRWAPVLALLIVADTVALSPFSWPHRSYAPPAAGITASIEGPGALLEIPNTTQADPPPGAWRNAGGLHQLEHGRPVSSAVMLLSPDEPSIDVGRIAQPLGHVGALRSADRDILLDRGFRWVLVYPAYHRGRGPGPDQDVLQRCLGPAIATTQDAWLFDLASRAGQDCAPVHTGRR